MIRFIFCSAVLITAVCAEAKNGGGQNIEAKIFKDSKNRTMPYRILIPQGYDSGRKYPLVLCMHGAGGRGVDNRSRGTEAFKVLSSPTVAAKYPAFLLTPQCPKGKKWVNTDWKKGSYSIQDVKVSEQLKMVMEILAMLCKKFNIDQTRIYVTGQSMGGYATWDLILRYPDVFAAAAPVCGAGDPAAAAKIANIPVWAFHGDKDRTVPTGGSKDMVAALKKLKSQVKYTEYPGVGHGSWKNAWKEDKLIPWLFAQHKDKK